MRLWPNRAAGQTVLLERVAAAEAKASEATAAAGELCRIIASSPMLGAPTPGQNPSGPYPLYKIDRPFVYSTPQAPQRRPQALVTLDDLRRIAETYDVLRSVIQHLKREIAAVPIRLVAKDDGDDSPGTQARIEKANLWFGRNGGCGGVGSRRSHFEATVIEDLLVLGSAAVWYQPARNGTPYQAIAIDSATIRPRVDAYGWPGPGENLYEQWVYGVLIRGFTRDELCFDGLYPISNSPYFKSPVEWLLTTVYSAIKADEWNRLWLTEGNVPGDFMTLPDTWTPDQVKDFTEYFDAIMSGNTLKRVKMAFLPGVKDGNPTRKDQEFQQFEAWMLRRTCSIFGVSPAAIGHEEKQYKVSQQGSMDQTTEFGAGEILEWRKSFYDDMLARIGFEDLECQNVTSQEEASSERAERNVKLVTAGIKLINEARADEGMEPVDGGDMPLVPATQVPLEHALLPPEPPPIPGAASGKEPPGAREGLPREQPEGKQTMDEKPSGNRAALDELLAWERKALHRLKDGKSLWYLTFKEKALPEALWADIRRNLAPCQSAEEVRKTFREARAILKTYEPQPAGPWERKHAGELWRARRLQAEREAELVEA